MKLYKSGMKKLLIFLSLSLIPLLAHSIFFKHIDTNEGLSQLSVMSIYQDRLGRMWFGTNEGVSIYNGERMLSFKPVINPDHDPRLSGRLRDNLTFPIVEDRNRNVYLKVSYSLVKYDMNTQVFEPLVHERVTSLSSIDGEIWFSHSDTIFRWNDEKADKEIILKTKIPYTINKIFKSTDQAVWIGTSHGLYRKTNASATPLPVIPEKDISDIYESSNGDLWIACRMEGMYRISRNGDITEYLYDPHNSNTIANNQVRTFLEDKDSNIWIGTFTGLQKYEPSTNRFTLYTRNNKLPGNLSHPSVFSLFMDHQGTIWVGTYYGGVNYFNPESDIFSYYTDDPQSDECLSYSFVGNMVEDKNGDVWVCTEGGGLNKLDRKTRKLTHYVSGNSSNSISHNNLKSIVYHRKSHCLYIGTHTGGLTRFDINKSRFTNYIHIWPNSSDKPSEIIHDIEIYGDSLYIMARNGLFGMDIRTQSIGRVFSDKNLYLYGTLCKKDNKNNLWIASTNSLLRVNLSNPKEHQYFNYGENGLGNFIVRSFMETSDGKIFFTTQGSGIYCYNDENQTFERYTVENGLLTSNYCYSMAQTPQGNLMISSDQGLSFFHPDKGVFEHINLGKNGLIISAINAGCGLLACNNGEIFVGGTDGLTTFFESDIPKINRPYNIYFSDLHIANELISPNDESNVLTRAFPFTRGIKLKHKQNNLIVTFATNNYINMLNSMAYEYKLEGFDTEWIPTTKTSVYYTNLNPGNYILKVREQDILKSMTPQEIEMRIDILAPIYATPWAYTLYFLIALSIVSVFVHFRYTKMKLKTSLEMEKKEKEQIEELNQAKLRFFTNISHEFRTPLTLIISQIELLLQNSRLSPSIYNKILKVYKHTYQMRNLISELLDFRKFEQHHVTLHVTDNDMVTFMKEAYLNFYEYAAARQITYEFQTKSESLSCWFDTVQMQKVVYNLLTNAFKYTRPQGVIEVIVGEENDFITVQIVDNGIGIEDKDINKIFDRFYQVGTHAEIQQSTGTGIGLALTKSIVESHHGTISVQSRPGYGSIFTVKLLRGNNHFTDDPKAIILQEHKTDTVKPDTLPDPLFMDNMIEAPVVPLTGESKEDHYSILIVEDNEELLQTLYALFAPLYRVILARNGEEGLQKTLEEKPDLVLSDVMMPRMTGTEMCLKIKSNIDISHIPVVLLTALTSNEQNMEGLQRGADDYIGKPFNAKLLLVRCNNLIRNRRLMQSKYHNQADFDGKLLATNQLDLNFMEKVESVIKDHMDNPDFDVNKLAKEMALGRSTLFSKFKGLTGMTPNEFILNYKLKYASALLRNHPDMQIADISDQLGFSSPRYFSRCFKAQFSVSPAEYRKTQ